MASPVNGFANNVIDSVTMADGVTVMWELEWEWQGVTFRGQCEVGHSLTANGAQPRHLTAKRCVRPPGLSPPRSWETPYGNTPVTGRTDRTIAPLAETTRGRCHQRGTHSRVSRWLGERVYRS